MSLQGVTRRLKNGPHVLVRPLAPTLDERGVWQTAGAVQSTLEGLICSASGENAQYLPEGVMLADAVEVYAEVELRADPGREDLVRPGTNAPANMRDRIYKVVNVRCWSWAPDGYTLWVAMAHKQDIP